MVKDYFDLSVEGAALQGAALRFDNKTKRAALHLDDVMLAVVSNVDDVGLERKLTSTREWLDLLSLAMDELRTSLIYATAILESMAPGDPELIRRSGRALAVGYFLENASFRAFSVGEKLAQLLNIFLGFGLREQREVCFQTVKKEVKDADLLGPLQAIADGLELTAELRHQHAHRFDPGVVRTRIEELRVNVGGSDRTARLWTMEQRPLSYAEELDTYSRTYHILDDALEVLLMTLLRRPELSERG